MIHALGSTTEGGGPALHDWSELAPMDWPTLLFGNGLSINIWEKFAYASLRDHVGFSPAAQHVFDMLGTPQFEQVLLALHHARIVDDGLGRDRSLVEDLHHEVREALFQAVNAAHIEYSTLGTAVLRQIEGVFATHANIFTSNYDLIPYWAAMSHWPPRTQDCLWGEQHTFTGTSGYAGRIIFYNHGGLHLWSDDTTGAEGKWIRSGQKSLRDAAAHYASASDGRRPLFVSEGTSSEKVRAIQASPYLRFCHERLSCDNNPTVVFGHALAEQDAHILTALSEGMSRKIAVSIYPHLRPETLTRQMAEISERLSRHDVVFFNSETHPLGSPTLRVAP